ncbi:MAG: hypothetical protein HY841_07025 [Bacteroidetes bacterium]|nr:hypothetical protein [Bacteroidota bacterium]
MKIVNEYIDFLYTNEYLSPMKKELLPLSGIFFRLAVLHALNELGVESSHSKEVPPPKSAKKIGHSETPKRKNVEIKNKVMNVSDSKC